MGKVLLKVEGMDGQVELLADRVVIHREGFWNALKFGFNAQREIPLSAISEVSFKNPSRLMFGEIDFIRSGMSGGAMGIGFGKKKPASPTAVKFKRDKQKQFEIFKEKVFELMGQHAKANH